MARTSSVVIGGCYADRVFRQLLRRFLPRRRRNRDICGQPGKSFSSDYQLNDGVVGTTFCTVVAFMRTCATRPWNVSLEGIHLKGNRLASLMFPTSDSSVFAYTSIFGQILRDGKNRRRLQGCGYVCPTSTLRATTVPSIGNESPCN